MQKSLIIYESKYGTTKKIAKYLAMVLGPAKYCRPADLKEEYKDFDLIVIGSPIYSGQILPEITEFVDKNLEWLKHENISIFSTSLRQEDGNSKLQELEKIIGKVVSKKALGGVLKLDKLQDKDLQSLNEFSKLFGFSLSDVDNFNLEEVVNYALKLKEIKDRLLNKMPETELQEVVEKFLITHNTCTLSTSYKERVSSTPIEYNYKKGHLYLLSEGGEKFANILLKKQVSLAVYEDFTTMKNLAGMQISGTACLVEDEEDYRDIIEKKGLNLESIKKLLLNMNIIKIKIEKVEFLYSKFRQMGYGVKQIYNFF